MFNSSNLLKIIRAGVYLALLTPLVYIPQTIFPAVFGKIIFFQIIIELALPFYIILILFNEEFRPKLKGLSAIIFLFFGIIALSAFLGADWLRSFWGYDERMRGLFSLLHFLFLYLFIIAAFRMEKDRKNLLLFFIGIGVVAALFGVAERIDPSLAINGISVKGPVAQRVMSTTGNPIFFAGYMLFVAFLSFYYFLSFQDFSRWFALGGFVLGAMNVMYTGTRGAFLGLAAGILVYLLFLFFISGKKYKIIFSAAALAIAVFLALAFVANIKVLKVNRFWDFERLTTISLSDGSVSGRLLLWKLSLRAAAEHPVLGWGLENFNYGFNKYYDPQFLRNGVSETFADRAHNYYLDWLVMAGALGLALYFAIWIAIAAKILKKENFSKENLVLLALIVGFSVHGLFAIEDPAQNLAMFFFFAFSSLVFWRGEDGGAVKKTGKIFFFVLAILSLMPIYFYNLKPLAAGEAYIAFLRAENSQDKKHLSEKMLSAGTPYADNFRFRFANETFFDAGKNSDPAYIDWAMARAAEEMKKVLERHPGDFSYYHTLGNIYLRMAVKTRDAKLFDTAAGFYKKALELSPERQAAMFQLSTVYLLKGDTGKAVDLLRQAVAGDDKAGQSHWRLGVALLANGRKDEAYGAFQDSIKLGFFDSIDNELLQVIALCAERKDYGCAVDVYKVITERHPGNANYFAQLAAAYAAAGKYEDAKTAVMRAVSLDPTLEAEARVFLEMIGY